MDCSNYTIAGIILFTALRELLNSGRKNYSVQKITDKRARVPAVHIKEYRVALLNTLRTGEADLRF
jgi:hypothetical protein